MKYDREFFHKQLLHYQSINFATYKNYTDVDILAVLVGTSKITELNEIDWGSFKYYLVDEYNEYVSEDRDRMEFVPSDEITTGSSLSVFIEKLPSPVIRIKVLVYFRDNTKAVFGTVTHGIEDFEHECVRLIDSYIQEAKEDDDLYRELMDIAKSGIYDPTGNTQESEIVTLRKQNQKLEREYRQLNNDLTSLQKKYDDLKTLWDNRNKRKKSIQYGIPSELQTDAAQWIIEKLQEKGYIRILRLTYNDAPIYNWEKSKSLFAYFVERLTYHLELRDTNEQIPWKMFEGAFIYGGKIDPSFHKGLKDIVSKYHKSGKIPQNDDVIERIFKETKEKPWLKGTTTSA